MNRHTTLFTRALDVALQNGYVFQLMEACEGMEMSKEARFIMRKCKARAEFYNKMTDFRQLLDKFYGAFFKMLADKHVQRMLAPTLTLRRKRAGRASNNARHYTTNATRRSGAAIASLRARIICFPKNKDASFILYAPHRCTSGCPRKPHQSRL